MRGLSTKLSDPRRARQAMRTGKRFTPARRFDMHAELDLALGAFNLKDAQEVHVRFSKGVAVFILERPCSLHEQICAWTVRKRVRS